MAYLETYREKQVYAIYVTRHILSGMTWNGVHVQLVSPEEMYIGHDTGNHLMPTVEIRAERLQRMLDVEISSLCK